MSSYTEDQQDAIDQFCAITDQTAAIAVPLLQKCQWNAQIAVTRFFDGDSEVVDPAAEPVIPSDTIELPRPVVNSRRDNLMDTLDAAAFSGRSMLRPSFQPAPAIPTESQAYRSTPIFLSLAALPFNVLYKLIATLFRSVAWAFPILPRLFTSLIYKPSPAAQSGVVKSSRDAVARQMIVDICERYKIAKDQLPFMELGYNQIRDLAKRDLKYLLVVLLSPEHEDNHDFVAQTLLSAPVTDFFLSHSKKDMLLWLGSVEHSEAYQVSAALNVTKLPFAGLVVYTPSISASSMSLVVRISGVTAPESFVKQLQQAMQLHDPDLISARHNKQEQQASRSIREEQNSAYERSLAQDRERARLKKETAAAAEKQALEQQRKADLAAQAAADRARWRRWRSKSLAPEPPTSAPPDMVSRVSIRLPSGERIVRRFAFEVPLEELYALVECHGLENEDRQKAEDNPPIDYTHTYGFRLVSPLPSEVFDLQNSSATIGTSIGRSGNLIVERNEDDEDNEDDND